MNLLDKNLQLALIPLAVSVGSTILFLVLRSFGLRLLEKWTRKTSSDLDDAVLGVFRSPSLAWCMALGIYLGVVAWDPPDKVGDPLYRAVHVILILSATLAVSNLGAVVFRHIMRMADNGVATSGLAVGIVKGGISTLGFLLILSVLGISIAPLLTALGVGGLAVALALKDTLENLFAGIYLLTDRAIRVGDFVKLETGQEGVVEDIGWRTTRVTLGNNNSVIMPNSKLAQSSVVNYSFPDNRLAIPVKIATALSEDADKIETILLDIAKGSARDLGGLLATPPPNVRMTFGDGQLEFTLSVFVPHYSDQAIVQHELRKRIHRRFTEEKISFPKRALFLSSEQTT